MQILWYNRIQLSFCVIKKQLQKIYSDKLYQMNDYDNDDDNKS